MEEEGLFRVEVVLFEFTLFPSLGQDIILPTPPNVSKMFLSLKVTELLCALIVCSAKW